MKERSDSICWRSKRVAVTQGLQKPSIFGVEAWALESVSYFFTSFAWITHRELVFNQAVVGRKRFAKDEFGDVRDVGAHAH